MPNITMPPEELQELMADVASVKLRDFHLGRVLEKFAVHLAHAHGLDPDVVADSSATTEETSFTDEKEGE